MPQLKSKVEQWLRQIGCTPVVQADPKADWHLQVDWPPTRGLSLNVVGPKGQPDRIVIAGGTEISHEHHDAFDKLDDDGKEEFLWKFRHTVNVQEADFELVGAEGRLDCPSRFLISATRYEDGLTLDSFARPSGPCSRPSCARSGSFSST